MSVYTPLEERSFLAAIAASNTIGAVIDSALFLWLVGLWSGELLQGQIVGKLLMTLAALPVVYLARRAITEG